MTVNFFGNSTKRKLRNLYSYSEAHNGRAVVVMRDGQLLGEDYHNGALVTDIFPLWSGTKTFSGIIAKQMIADGIIPSLDMLVADVLPDWRDGGPKSTTTLRRVLSLTSGLKTTASLTYQPSYEVAAAGDMPASDVGKFQYGNEPFGVFGAFCNVLLKPLNYSNAVHYLREKVLAPADIEYGSWARDQLNQPWLGGDDGGCHMRTREWAKFGQFMLERNDFYKDLTGPGPDYWAYGFGCWRCVDELRIATDGKATKPIPANGYAAIGHHNQLLYVLPGIKTVVARNGGADPTFIEAEYMDLIMELA